MAPSTATRPVGSFGASPSALESTTTRPSVSSSSSPLFELFSPSPSLDLGDSSARCQECFLHGTPTEIVYCSQPTGFVDFPDLVSRLNCSLYGLEQASRAWYNRSASYLASIGFIEAKSDTSLFIYRRGNDIVYLLLYVDDIVLTASTADLLQRTIGALQREFVMKDLGPLHFLGITAKHRP
jgi:hypothetical protein